MPEAVLDGEGGKRVTITISEEPATNTDDTAPVAAEPDDDPNTFVISNGKYKLTITIAE